MSNEELAQQINELAQRMDNQFAKVRSDIKTLDSWLRSEVDDIIAGNEQFSDLKDRVEHLEQAAD